VGRLVPDVSDPVAIGLAVAFVIVALVAVVLAIVNRRARRWRIGIFYERDDNDDLL
jgi:hypothetical protein